MISGMHPSVVPVRLQSVGAEKSFIAIVASKLATTMDWRISRVLVQRMLAAKLPVA